MAKLRKDEPSGPHPQRPSPPNGVAEIVAAPARRGHDLGTTWPAWFRPTSPPTLCAVNAAHVQHGVATLLVLHRMGSAVVCAHFVVDLFAYGVTDCFGESFGVAEFDRYLAEVDDKLALETITPEHAGAILAIGVRIGEGYGIAQPETLPLWRRLLPDIGDPDAWERTVFGGPRPIAGSDLIRAHRMSVRGPWLSDAPAPPVLLVPSNRDH